LSAHVILMKELAELEVVLWPQDFAVHVCELQELNGFDY